MAANMKVFASSFKLHFVQMGNVFSKVLWAMCRFKRFECRLPLLLSVVKQLLCTAHPHCNKLNRLDKSTKDIGQIFSRE